MYYIGRCANNYLNISLNIRDSEQNISVLLNEAWN